MDGSKKWQVGEQVKRLRRRFGQTAGAALGEVVPMHLLRQWVDEEVAQWRERLYSPLQTLLLFIEQVLSADQSCQDAVARAASARVALGQPPGSLNSGPYCKARRRLPLALPQRLAREAGERLCAQQPKAWLWRGRQVKLVDGTTVSMPDTAQNQSQFPQSPQQRAQLGFPLARLVAIVSLSCGAVLDWALSACEGARSAESALLWGMAQQLQRSDVLIADRCYASYFMIALLSQQQVDVVMRQHPRRLSDFRRGQRLGVRDHLVIWTRPARPGWMDEATYASMPHSLRLREARVAGWTLVSTLTEAKQVAKDELAKLYRLRWQVELDLRAIKSVMHMDVLHCKSPPMVRKEIAVHMAAYNLVRTVMAQAAHLGAVLPRQLSFKGALQVLRAFEENLRHCPRGRFSIRRAYLLGAIAQLRLPERPGRVEPRAVKRRPKPHALLTQPRPLLRERLRRQQQRHINRCSSLR